jgi:hypothetical protein
MQSSAPDDGLKHRPKHVEPILNNKLIFVVSLVGYIHSCNTMHGFINVKFDKQFNPYPANVENMVSS